MFTELPPRPPAGYLARASSSVVLWSLQPPSVSSITQRTCLLPSLTCSEAPLSARPPYPPPHPIFLDPQVAEGPSSGL